MNCYKHPDRAAKRKCYKCKRPVCPDCQVKSGGHIFCSEECRQEWLKKLEAHKKRSAAKKAVLKPGERLAALEQKAGRILELEEKARRIAELEEKAKRIAELEEKTERLSRLTEKAEKISRLEAEAEKLASLEAKMDESSASWSQLELKLKKVEQNQASLQSAVRNGNRGKNARWIALLGLVLSLAALAGLVISLVSFSRHGSPKIPGEQTLAKSSFDPGYPGTLLEEKYLEPPNLELWPGELAAARGKIDLYGRAPAARRVSFLINGRESASVSTRSAEFVFKGVELGPGANIIQVLSRDDKGNLAYSIAELVDYKGRETARVRYTPGLNYSRGSREFPALAITFDAGGSEGYAEKVLEVLRERKIKTTIFVTGDFIAHNPDVVRRMVEEGHEVGNHTYSHPHLTTFEQNRRQWTRPEVSKEFLQNELWSTARLFQETTASEMAHFWRAPFGEQNAELRRWAEEAGFYHIDWCRDADNSYDTLDWLTDKNNEHYRDSEQIRKLLVNLDRSGPANGAIVLMHLSTDRGKDFPEKVIAPAIDALEAKGYKIIKVSELFPGLAGREDN